MSDDELDEDISSMSDSDTVSISHGSSMSISDGTSPSFGAPRYHHPNTSISDVSSMHDASSIHESVMSFDPARDAGSLFIEHYGRGFNAQSAQYAYPSDDIEYSRLTMQHMVHVLSLGGLYQATETVQKALSADTGPKLVLDLGSGGGNWIISMANEFPHAEVVGVDLAPKMESRLPPNCRVEFDDVNLGLPHYHGKCDVVHAQSMQNGTTDFPMFIHEMVQCLKPGGVLLIVEGDLQLLDHDLQPMEAAYEQGDGGSWMSRMLFEAYNCQKARGSSVDAGLYLYRWVLEHPLLEREEERKIFTPIGPWARGVNDADTQRLMVVGDLMRQNSMEFVRALKPLLIGATYPEEMLDHWIAGTDEELSCLSVRMHVQWHYACATKKL